MFGVFEVGLFWGVPVGCLFFLFICYLMTYSGARHSKLMGSLFFGMYKHLGMGNVYPGVGVFIYLLFVLVFLNLMGLIPMGVSVTSMPAVTLSFGFGLWGSGYLYCFRHKIVESIAHFLPMGAPMGMGIFLVWIEVISWLCRPLALGVRLMANITAGHVLLLLVGMGCFGIGLWGQVLCGVLMLLVFLEIGVAFIQGYVYCLLLSLYMNEGLSG
uniref:ATP synthase subunit a n=1 Tax=Halocynthia hilgendorfi ssp. n. KRK-2020 TaxID=2769794 RepID=A0A7G9XFL1_9ASCI|nr:ATP synthase F0 subunit 6 [Halocynthia hilgendorfi ssp. n. KRK-2020]